MFVLQIFPLLFVAIVMKKLFYACVGEGLETSHSPSLLVIAISGCFYQAVGIKIPAIAKNNCTQGTRNRLI